MVTAALGRWRHGGSGIQMGRWRHGGSESLLHRSGQYERMRLCVKTQRSTELGWDGVWMLGEAFRKLLSVRPASAAKQKAGGCCTLIISGFRDWGRRIENLRLAWVWDLPQKQKAEQMKQSSKKSDIDQSLVVAIFTKKSHTATLMIRITEKSLKKPLKILTVEVIGPWERMLKCLGQVKRMGLRAWEGMHSDSGFASCLASGGGLPYSAFYRVVGGLSGGPGKYRRHSVNAFCFIEVLCSLVLCLHVWGCLIPWSWS